MLQHAIFTIPNRREGYTTDDNARALIFTVLLEHVGKDHPDKDERENPNFPVANFSARYLSFLEHAFNPAKGRFKKLPWL